jgi:hypothetical protein
MIHPTREQIIEKAIADGAEFVTQSNGEKSVSSRDYRAAAQALMNVKPEPKPKPPLSEARIREMNRNQW